MDDTEDNNDNTTDTQNSDGMIDRVRHYNDTLHQIENLANVSSFTNTVTVRFSTVNTDYVIISGRINGSSNSIPTGHLR